MALRLVKRLRIKNNKRRYHAGQTGWELTCDGPESLNKVFTSCKTTWFKIEDARFSSRRFHVVLHQNSQDFDLT